MLKINRNEPQSKSNDVQCVPSVFFSIDLVALMVLAVPLPREVQSSGAGAIKALIAPPLCGPTTKVACQALGPQRPST
ncbi:hypothetical protein DVA81_18590 [Acinetobacter baumannii]|nr:hypothetical protein DVA81_18590 [Acinetobacter baumannii]